MSAHDTFEQRREWLHALIERVARNPSLLDAFAPDADRVREEDVAACVQSVLLVLTSIEQALVRDAALARSEISVLGRPRRREPSGPFEIVAQPNAHAAHVLGLLATAHVYGCTVSLTVCESWASACKPLLQSGDLSVTGRKWDDPLGPETIVATAQSAASQERLVFERAGVGMLWLPSGLLPQHAALVADTMRARSAAQSGAIHLVLSPAKHQDELCAKIANLAPIARPNIHEQSPLWSQRTPRFLACEDHREVIQCCVEVGRPKLFCGVAQDPALLESIGCRSRAEFVLVNRSPSSVLGGFAWLSWDTRRAVELLTTSSVLVRQQTESEPVAPTLSLQRLRWWMRGLLQQLTGGAQRDELW